MVGLFSKSGEMSRKNESCRVVTYVDQICSGKLLKQCEHGLTVQTYQITE